MSMAKPILLQCYVSLPSEWFCLHNWKSEAADFHPPSEILNGLYSAKDRSQPNLPAKIMLNVNANIKTRSLYEPIVRHGVSGKVRRSRPFYTLYTQLQPPKLSLLWQTLQNFVVGYQLKYFAARSRQFLLGYLIISMKNEELLCFTQHNKSFELLSCSQMVVREESL